MARLFAGSSSPFIGSPWCAGFYRKGGFLSFFSSIGKFQRKTPHQKILFVASVWTRIKSRWYYPSIFGSFGKDSLLFSPAILHYPEFIHVGKRVSIRSGARLEAIPTGSGKPNLVIGDSVNLEQNVHIVCHNRVVIERNVSVTANCAIVDTTHPFDDLPCDLKVGEQIRDDDGFVEIGEGTFLGIGCVVLPNVRIGKGCVIGANSVVTRDIPDYSVAAGSPAVVTRTIRKLPHSVTGRADGSPVT
jgi:acetyltransferase-like isoleucine patch superfamily enzyme